MGVSVKLTRLTTIATGLPLGWLTTDNRFRFHLDNPNKYNAAYQRQFQINGQDMIAGSRVIHRG